MDVGIKKGFTTLITAVGIIGYVEQPQVKLAHDVFIVEITMFCGASATEHGKGVSDEIIAVWHHG